MAKGVAHAGKGKSLSAGNAIENERLEWDEDSYRLKNENPINNYDWSRHALNFEVINGEIKPLGSQEVHLYDRYQNVLKNIDFKEYKAGASNQQNAYVELILSGSTELMQQLAFGSQEVNYERNPSTWHNWNVTREKAIEQWAVDSYNFACKMYGKENVIGFEVHLDETEPHAHVNIVPVAMMKQRGNVGGYVKIDADGNDVRYTKGKHVGELVKLSQGKYDALPEEKKRQYRPAVRGMVRTISFATFFGSTKKERSEKMSELHDKYYEHVGSKWGLERGDVWKLLDPEERQKRKRLTKQQAHEKKMAEEAKAKAQKEAKEANEIRDAAVREKDAAVREKDAVIKEKDVAVKEKDEALKLRDTAIDKTVEQQGIIDRQQVSISSNRREIDKLKQEKEEVQKEVDVLRSVTLTPYQSVERYVKALQDITFTIPSDVIEKLSSPLKNHPRITSVNPPLTVQELETIAMREIDKVYDEKTFVTYNSTIQKRVKAILTDKQTILFSVVGNAQKRAIADANRELYKDIKKRLAESETKVLKYNELEKAGINKTSYEHVVKERDEAQEAAKRMPETERMLEFAWPGVTKAKNILIDPTLDKNYMTNEQKKDILNTLRKDPKNRLDDIKNLLSYACSFRDIPIVTRAEAIELATESIIKHIAEQGYDLIKEATSMMDSVAQELEMAVADAASRAASAAVCLIFGYLDGATTVSTGCGGGGESNELPKKKDDEDEKKFWARCLSTAIGMMKPKRRSQGIKFH